LPLRAVSYALMRSAPFMERVLILGSSTLTRPLIREIENHPDIRWGIVGVVDSAGTSDEPRSRYTSLGPLERIDKILEAVRVDRIVVTLTERRARLPLSPLLEARRKGVIVENGADVYERLTGTLPLESLTPGVLVFSDAFRKAPLADLTTRAIGIVASVVGLVCTAPLLALIAVAIKLDSTGPVLFVQPRIGLGGRAFTLLKFRTMRPVATGTSEWVCDNSERITRVGKVLRKFRLDELPQFVNIVRGDMNLVGPRPHPVSNLELFTEKIPYYAFRSAVRPGVTGWAQVRYGYANTLAEEIDKMRYDLYYVKHRSLWFDLRIVVDTVKIVLFGRGSKAADAYPAEARLSATVEK
jgi:exopolysaccharide biosynthesis polyprenyl glycosylphosphotransferase